MLTVIKPGLETCVQDYPGRLRYLDIGYPINGPMDSWSFRLANVLVGNPPGLAALECQFVGPTLRFERDAVAAVSGADMLANLDGKPVAPWESFAARSGQVLEMKAAVSGARGYMAVAGGIAVPMWLGSRSTYHKAGVGGLEGHALKAGQTVPLGPGSGVAGKRVKASARPQFPSDKRWIIEVVPGPNDDWIDEAGRKSFLESEWKLTGKSDRTGFRLEGPKWTFAEKALNKSPESGSDPSNTVEHAYPLGAVNLAGQTPILLMQDALTMGGFINPYTVPSAAFWKIGQARPGEIFRFRTVTVGEAQALRRDQTRICSPGSIE